jgi:uncharacterized protein YjaG (DUF416 family)
MIKTDSKKRRMSDEQKKNSQKAKEEWDALHRVVELFRRYSSGEVSPRERNSIETW